MNGSTIQLDTNTENTIRHIFPVTLSENDLEWAADWFLMVGISTVSAALRDHPEFSIGDLISLSFKLNQN